MFALFFSHESSGFDHHMTDKARSPATIDRLEGQLRELKRKVSLYKTRLKLVQLEVDQLKKPISDIEDQFSLFLPSPCNCIFRDANNCQIPENRCHDSIETLTWGRMVDDILLAAWETVRSMPL
jgi:hypothetical protein